MRFTALGDAQSARGAITRAFAVYGATLLMIAMGASALDTSATRVDAGQEKRPEIFRESWLTHGDGWHFVAIAREGYSYDPQWRSHVAFFPLFPLAGRAIAITTGISVEKALLIAAHGYLLGAFVLLALYARQRYGECAANVGGYALLAFGLFPTTFFFRMVYSESSFLFLAILAMLAIERRWPMAVTASIVGLATATRAVGLALVPVFCMSVWRLSAGRRHFAFRSMLLLPLALWGLIAYMTYQYCEFGQPFAFAVTQEHWHVRGPASIEKKALALLAFEPVWTLYQPSSEAYWQRIQPEPLSWSNLAMANPLYFLFAVALVILGGWKGWLNANETVLAAFLILIPYVTRGFEMCMLSQGRFIAAAFPVYLVMGHLLSKIPAPYAALLLCLSGLVMAIYAAEFAAGYMLI